jgi:hypothetical protein
MQLKVEDLDKIRELAELQAELAQIKERELSLRKEVAFAVIGNRNMTPCRKSLTLGDTKITCEFKEVLKIIDKDELQDFVDDDTLPSNTVVMQPHTTLGKLKKVSDDHPIWGCVYTDVSPTPMVKIETVE